MTVEGVWKEIGYFGPETYCKMFVENDIYDICENTNNETTENTEIINFLLEDETDYEWILNE